MFYIDESLHPRHGFNVVGFAYSEQPLDDLVASVLESAGLRPGVDEFKSNAAMSGSPELHELRENLRNLVARTNTRVAFLFTSPDRGLLGEHTVRTLGEIIKANGLSPRQTVYIDEGLIHTQSQLEEAVTELTRECDFSWREDSRRRFGLQLADLLANSGAYAVKEQIDGPRKFVDMSTGPSKDEEHLVELGWFLKMMIRRNFFCEPKEYDDDVLDMGPFFTRELINFGVFIQPDVAEPVRTAIIEALGETWLGCLH